MTRDEGEQFAGVTPVTGKDTTMPGGRFQSYYGQPVIKPPIWHEPHMPLYLYLGGLSGTASVMSAMATLTGHERLGHAARITSFLAAASGSVFLVTELGRPERFLNMLRVFKVTSPMSVGSWILSAHSALTGLAAASSVAAMPGASKVTARLPAWITALLPAAGDAAALAATVTGPLMSTYTAVLIADTAVPAWHEAYQELPFLFAGSALASAGAWGMLATPRAEAGPARAVAVVGAAMETAAGAVMEHRLGLVGEPYRQGKGGQRMRIARALTAGGALLATVAGRSRALTVLSGLSLTAGALYTRFGILEAGRASAADPKYTVVPQRERLDAGKAAAVPAPPGSGWRGSLRSRLSRRRSA